MLLGPQASRTPPISSLSPEDQRDQAEEAGEVDSFARMSWLLCHVEKFMLLLHWKLQQDFTTFDRTLQKRPQSTALMPQFPVQLACLTSRLPGWRMGRPDQLRSGGENVRVLDVFAVLYGDMCRKSRQVLQHWRTARQHPSEHSKDSKCRCMGRGQTLQDHNPPTKNEETHR